MVQSRIGGATARINKTSIDSTPSGVNCCRFLTHALLLCCLGTLTPTRAATITGNLLSITGAAHPDKRVTFSPVDTPRHLPNGSILWTPRVVTSANGVFTVVLTAGHYRVSIDGIVWAYRCIPDSDATYTFNDPAIFCGSGTGIFLNTNDLYKVLTSTNDGVPQYLYSSLLAGTNIFLQELDDGTGTNMVVKINSSGGSRISNNQGNDDGSTMTITNIYGAAGATLWTNIGGTLQPLVGDQVLVTNLTSVSSMISDGSLHLRGISSSNLVAGMNNLTTFEVGTFQLRGPTTTPSDTQVGLNTGIGYQLLVIQNAFTNSAFQMLHGQPQWDNPTDVIHLHGDWNTTNKGDMLLLYNNGNYWAEIGRSWADTNVVSPVVMNPTDNYLPVRESAGVFRDSPLATPAGSTNLVASGALILGGTNSVDYFGGSFSGLTLGSFNDNTKGGDGTYQITVGGGDPNADQGYALIAGNAISSFSSANVVVDSDVYTAFLSAQTPPQAGGVYAGWNSTNQLALAPFMEDNPSKWVYKFDSAYPLAQTGLATFQNNTTNMLSIGPRGQIIFGPGTTNVLYRSGSSLVVTNGATTNAFTLRNGLGTGFHMTYNPGGNPRLDSDNGFIWFADTTVFEGNLIPDSGNTRSLGTMASNGSFADSVFSGLHYILGSNDAGANYSRLAIDHNDSNIRFDSQSLGTGVARDFLFQSNGVTVAKVALNSGYTGGGTLFLSDDGTFKSAGGGGGGSTLWANASGVIKPLGGQVTNALLFTSGSVDNATNSILTLDTVNAWTNIEAKFLQGRNQGTNTMFITKSGALEIGRSVEEWWLPDDTESIVSVHDISKGESDYNVFHMAALDHIASVTNFASHTLTLVTGYTPEGTSPGAIATWKATTNLVDSTFQVFLQPENHVARLELVNRNTRAFYVDDISGYEGGGTKFLSDDGSYKTVGGGGTVGTVINTGASTVGAVPRYTDLTGTNIAPTSVTISGSSITAGASTFTGEITSTLGTITSDASALDATATWNASGVTFSGLSLDVTDTASAAASRLMNLSLGGAGRLRVFKSNGVMQFGADVGTGSWGTSVSSTTITLGRPTGTGGVSAGTEVMEWNSNNTGMSFRGNISLGTTSLARDAIIERDAANTFQFNTDSATAVAATLKGPDGSGTDKVGGALQLGGGKSTGTAAGGAVILHTANSAGASGSSVNSNTERFHAPAKFVTLTESSATTIYTIPVPATNYVGLTATVTIYATDGTDHQSLTSQIRVDAIAKTTVITPTVTQTDNTTAASSGTLTCTYTVTDNGSNVMAIKANAVSSLSQTVLRAKLVLTAINSNGTAAGTEQ